MRLDEPTTEALARLKTTPATHGIVLVSDLTGELLCNACDELGVAGHDVEALRTRSAGARPDDSAWRVPIGDGERLLLVHRLHGAMTPDERSVVQACCDCLDDVGGDLTVGDLAACFDGGGR